MELWWTGCGCSYAADKYRGRNTSADRITEKTLNRLSPTIVTANAATLIAGLRRFISVPPKARQSLVDSYR